MDIVISHTSALKLLRAMRHPAGKPCASGLPCKMPTTQELQSLQSRHPALFEAGAVDILLSEKNATHPTLTAHPHVWSTPLPEGAFVQIAPGLRCVSPAFLAVQMASRLSFLEMNLLLAELLGLYAVYSEEGTGLSQRAHPLLTPQELEGFLDKLGSAWGTRAVRQALRTAPAQAASPMEAKLYLRATLPLAKGGYNMGKVVLNDPFELRRISANIRTLQVRKPDLLFLGGNSRGVCLDYMGAWHDDATVARKDTRRRNELLAAGFKPYEIFKNEYDSLDYMDGLMHAIAQDLGLNREPPRPAREKKYRAARLQLWRELESIDTSFLGEKSPDKSRGCRSPSRQKRTKREVIGADNL